MPSPPGVRHTSCPTVLSHALSFHQAGITRKREEGVGGPVWVLPDKPGLHVTNQ